MLLDLGAQVTMVADGAERRDEELPSGVTVVDAHGPWPRRLRDADLAGKECLLVLSEDDLLNLQIVAAAHEVAPDVPVVLRAFDARLVEQFELGVNVRRCFSSSALAAPAFVAAIFDQEVLNTLRLGDDEVPLCVLRLHDDSPLVGLTAGAMKEQWSCAAVAHEGAEGPWHPVIGDGQRFVAGDRLLVGGLLLDVLRLARRNAPRAAPAEQRNRGRRRVTLPGPTEGIGRVVVLFALCLVALLVITAVVFAIALGLGPIDAAYRALTNAFGDVSLSNAPGWLKVFGITVMILGAVLIGVVLAHVTATLTASRLEQQAGRRARRMRGHVVIAGLGMLGFRVDRLLDELDMDTVIIEQQLDLSRFREAAAFHTPVLSGDARLPENLQRAGIERACAIVACTENDLVNVSACVEGHRLNPDVRTVARIFHDDLAEQLSTFGIDAALSMSKVAAAAFIGAATDERAMRWIGLGDLELAAFRHELDRPVPASELTSWREEGLRVLAVHPRGSRPLPPSAVMHDLAAGTEIIVAGPAPVVERCLFGGSGVGPTHDRELFADDRVVRRPMY